MLYLSGIILAFFLSFVLGTKKNKTHADFILVAWLAVTGFHLLTFYMFFNGLQVDYPTLVGIGLPLPLAQGPFLYLYTRQQTSAGPFDKKQLLHFLPVVLSYLLFFDFYFLTTEQKAAVFTQKGRGFEMQSLINLYAIYLSGLIYIILSLVRLLKYRKQIVHQFSNTDKINFNWLLYLIIWMTGIWMTIYIVQDDKWIFAAAALFVGWLGYFGIKQVQVFSENSPGPLGSPPASVNHNNVGNINLQSESVVADPAISENPGSLKYQKSTLSEQDVDQIHERLKTLMSEQKPFTNPDLTLNELAKNLEVHPNHLSQVINSKENKNFYDLVNEQRVQEFIKMVSKPLNMQYTLVALAFDCGFNSKASFNRNFKKYTGLTPSDFLKQNTKEAA